MLTNTKIKQMKPKDVLYREIDSNGLYIEVRTSGKKYWRVRANIKGKETMKSLGEYPQIEIKEARLLRDDLLLELRSKGDENPLFKKVALEWLEHKDYRGERNKDIVLRRFENYIFPVLGELELKEIKPSDILPLLKSIEASGFLELAIRVQNIISQVFKYGARNLMCESDPAGLLAGATRKPKVRPMPAIVDYEGFKDLLRRIEQADRLYKPIHFCLRLAPYVALRSGEMRALSPNDVDLVNKTIVIPEAHTKMGRSHIVPLSEGALNIVKEALCYSTNELLFPGIRNGRPISENSLNVALRALGYPKGEVVFHGFRSSFSTLGREILRFDSNLIERQLAHIESNKVIRAYDRSFKLEERTEMMDEWGVFIDGLKSDGEDDHA